MNIFLTILKRDMLLYIRNIADFYNPPLFFVLVIILYPFALGAENDILKNGAAGLVWVAALLSSMLSLDNLFKEDFSDGTLEEMILSPHSLGLIVSAKILVFWLFSGFALTLLSPLLALMLGLPFDVLDVLVISLLLGTPVLSLVGAVGAALTLGLKNNGVILSLLILPLYIPVLIFGSSAVNNAMRGFEITGNLYIMLAFLVLAITLCPLAVAVSLKLNHSN
jgi:heme exporter protein B